MKNQHQPFALAANFAFGTDCLLLVAEPLPIFFPATTFGSKFIFGTIILEMLQYVGAQKRHAHTHTEIFFFLSIEYIENGCRTGCHRKNMLCVFVFKLKVVFIKCVCLRVCACIHVGVCVCVNLCVCVWNENERETTTTKPVLEVHKKWHTHTPSAVRIHCSSKAETVKLDEHERWKTHKENKLNEYAKRTANENEWK